MKKVFYCFLIITSYLFPQGWQLMSGPYGGKVYSIAVNSQGDIYASRYEAIYKSTNSGESWNSLQNNPSNINVFTIDPLTGKLFAGSSFLGVWWSNNDGASWTYNQITHNPHSGLGASVSVLGLNNGSIFTESFRSDNGGQTFIQLTVFAKSYLFRTGEILAGTNNGLKKSTDNGNSWTSIGSPSLSGYISSLVELSDGTILAGTTNGAYYSTDNGNTWTTVTGLADLSIYTFCNNSGVVYAGTSNGVYISSNNGINWDYYALSGTTVNSIKMKSSDIIAATNRGVYIYSGSNWEFKNKNLFLQYPKGLAASGNKVFVPGGTNLYFSSNYGINWEERNNGLPASALTDVQIFNNKLFIGTWTMGIYSSNDYGLNWFPSNGGIADKNIASIASSGNNIFALAGNRLFKSNDSGLNWFQVNQIDTTLISSNFVTGPGGRICMLGVDMAVSSLLYYSTDSGETWNLTSFPSTNELKIAAMNSAGRLFSIFEDKSLKYSDDGINFVNIPGTPWSTIPGAMTITSNGTIVVSVSSVIYYSTNSGINWNTLNSGLPSIVNSTQVTFLKASGNALYLGTVYKGIYRNDFFDPTPVELLSFSSIVNDNNVILKWETATETNNKGFVLERLNNSIWKEVDFIKGMGSSTVKNTYTYSDNNLAAGKYIYRLKQIDLNGAYDYSNQIEAEINRITDYSLSQNYPNPFNPSTRIKYSIPEKTAVKLSVFNILGKEIAVLVNEVKQPGVHEIDFNASDLSSGVYIYQLTAGSHIESRRMVLIK